MKKVGLTQRHQTERAIIDALLKISEIVQKTESSRQRQKSTNTNKRSKNTIGDGDYNDVYDDNEQQRVPVPPPMRTLDSYVSGFNQKSVQKPSNCNQASTYKSTRYPAGNNQIRFDANYKNQIHSLKRHCYDTSSTSSSSSNDYYHQKKFSKQHSSQRSFRSNEKPQPIYQETEKTDIQPTLTTFHSTSPTIFDDPPSSLNMMPVASAPAIPPSMTMEQQPFSPSSDTLTNPKIVSDLFIDQQLQATLEKHLLSSTKLTNEYIQQQRKTRLSTLPQSETGKLIDQLDSKQGCNFEYYENQRELALLAAQQGNYSLSYSIYTNLLHDNQYNCKFKSEILASRATTLLLKEKCFESIDDCTQAIAYNQWNKLAYVVRAACWMIKQEYFKAVEDYSKLFHFFDQSEHVLDLLNLAYEKFKLLQKNIEKGQSIKTEQEKEDAKKEKNIIQPPITSSIDNQPPSLSLASPTTSFIQPAVYLCYPYQACPTCSSTNNEQQPAYLSNRVLRDSPESRKIPFVPSRGTIGTVPKFFRDGTNGIGTIRKISGRDIRDRDKFEKN